VLAMELMTREMVFTVAIVIWAHNAKSDSFSKKVSIFNQ